MTLQTQVNLISCCHLPVREVRAYRQQRYQDALAIVAKRGMLSLLLTMTCNSQWTKITGPPGQSARHRPDSVARVFEMKRRELLDDIIKKGMLGVVNAYLAVIEFQKRGLPHMHLLLIFDDSTRPKSADDYNRFVCAKIPPPTCPLLQRFVLRFHIHGPCGKINTKSPCMENNVCTKHYPMQFRKASLEGDDGRPEYRRRGPKDKGQSVETKFRKKKITVTNRNVVPYNPALLMKY